MAWSEAKWVVDQLMNKLGTAPNNMRAFTAYAVSKSSLGLNQQTVTIQSETCCVL